MSSQNPNKCAFTISNKVIKVNYTQFNGWFDLSFCLWCMQPCMWTFRWSTDYTEDSTVCCFKGNFLESALTRPELTPSWLSKAAKTEVVRACWSCRGPFTRMAYLTQAFYRSLSLNQFYSQGLNVTTCTARLCLLRCLYFCECVYLWMCLTLSVCFCGEGSAVFT